MHAFDIQTDRQTEGETDRYHQKEFVSAIKK